MRAELDKLTLSNKAIWEREHARPSIKCAFALRSLLCWR
jgi:hypothetical protein